MVASIITVDPFRSVAAVRFPGSRKALDMSGGLQAGKSAVRRQIHGELVRRFLERTIFPASTERPRLGRNDGNDLTRLRIHNDFEAGAPIPM